MENCTFEENFSFDKGGVVWGDYKSTKTFIRNSQFRWNGALYGGVFSPLYESLISCENCLFEENFGFIGGNFFSHNHGYLEIRDSEIQKNFAFSVKVGEFLDTINL